MPAELFSIFCTTCRARLRVHRPELIGQIMTCPKCASMVQILPPPDWSESSGATNQTPRPMSATPPALPVRRVVAPPPLPKKKQRARLLSATAPPLRRAGGPEHWLPVLTAGLGGVLVGLLVWVVVGFRSTDRNLAQQSLPAWDASFAEEAGPPLPAVGAAESTTSEPTFAHFSAEGSPGGGTAAEILNRINPEADIPSNKPAHAPKAIAAAKAEAHGATSQELHKPIGPVVVAARGAAVKPASPTATMTSPKLKEFTFGAPQAQVASPDVAKAAQAAAANTAKPAPAPPRAPQPVDVRARLRDRLSTIDFRAVPLNEFATFMSELSTIPVEIDHAGLKRAGKSAATPVTVQLTRTTIAKAVAAALEPHGLTLRIEPTKVVITPAN